ncbi:hypothetical protein A3K86_14955 [Photobacterium jeanii]|uniref:Lipoprotein n=1 Tax=Photobacterium jeanii TaxID=858640 RepID=A0A178K6K9_9GAMM|nr:hypothetical protein [Photobacterium jeanii]OAN12968.1 hypothetical protein A3K86_14955 [Photobacterium jeanii]PST89116.1 hypothetical protein C9I91_13400 [Photobacterium jeanii]
MQRRICTLLISAWLTACGGGGGDNAQPQRVSVKPQAINVDFKEPRTEKEVEAGEQLIGQYTFSSKSVPPAIDASWVYWETLSGHAVHRGLEYRVPYDNSLAGERIRFCVVPVNHVDRKVGDKTCSPYYLINSRPMSDLPSVGIIEHGYFPIYVGSLVQTALVDPDGTPVSEEEAKKYLFEWYSDGQLIAGENEDSYTARAEDEGKHLSVCIIDTKSNVLVSCYEMANKVAGLEGEPPVVDLQPLGETIEVGLPQYLIYEFIDFDNDKEDSFTTAYSWYVGDKFTSDSRLFIPTAEMLGKQVKGCVTPYSLTGHPKAQDIFCTAPSTVTAVADTKPRIQNLAITGSRFAGNTLMAQYDYFDADQDEDTTKRFEWFMVRDDELSLVSTTQSYTVATGDEGAKNQLALCVTPENAKETGATVCVNYDMPALEARGELNANGEVKVSLKGYPEFKRSYWLSTSQTLPLPIGLVSEPNQPAVLKIDEAIASINNLHSLKFCISPDERVLNEDDVCREVTLNNRLHRGVQLDLSDQTRIAMNVNQRVKYNYKGFNYDLRRPFTWAEFVQTGLADNDEYNSAEPVVLTGSDIVGLKMTPEQANQFCRRTFGAQGVISSPLFASLRASKTDLYGWPMALMEQAFLTKQYEGAYVIDADVEQVAESQKKYPFICYVSETNQFYGER